MKAAKTKKPIGRLIVFEGADGAGKTTISKRLAKELTKHGKPCLWLAFPGHIPNTIGAEVYVLHHDNRFASVPALSRQLLHVAAHVEAIQQYIIPALKDGYWVVLDRYWWSTWVYGLVTGVARKDLRGILDIEHRQWRNIRPAIAFLLERAAARDGECSLPTEEVVQKPYRRLATVEGRAHQVLVLKNNGTPEATTERALAVCLRLQ